MPSSRLLKRDLTGQERVGWCIQSDEEKKKNLPIKNSMPRKAVLQERRRDKDFPREAKAEEVQHHQTCLIRNTKKVINLKEKRMLMSDTKYWKYKTHWKK